MDFYQLIQQILGQPQQSDPNAYLKNLLRGGDRFGLSQIRSPGTDWQTSFDTLMQQMGSPVRVGNGQGTKTVAVPTRENNRQFFSGYRG